LVFEDIYFLEIEIHLKDSSQLIENGPDIVFEERVSFIIKLMKKYYYILTMVVCFVVTALLTICVAILRFVKVA
jgi:hypothetical protein